MKRIHRGFASIAVLAALVSGCGGGADDSSDTAETPNAAPPEAGGVLKVGLYAEPNTLDPAQQPFKAAYQVLLTVCEGLYTVDANMEPVPQLATDYPEISDDGLTVTVPLRTGVVFNDGEPFDAEAAKYAIERNIEFEGSSVAEDFAAVEEIEAVDAETLVFHLEWSDARIVNALASFAGMIASPAQLDALGDDYGTEPVCVAPFELDEWTAGVSLTLSKSELYYDAENVALDGVEYVIIPDGNVRAVNLSSGDIDAALSVAPEDSAALEAADDIDMHTQTGIGWNAFQVNMANQNGIGEAPEPLDTPLAESEDLRRALDLAIDRQAIVDAISQGLYHPSCSPLSPSSPFYDEPDCPERDIDTAKQLVEDSGYPTPVKFELTSISGSNRVEEMIQSMVAEAGFEM
ncbi:ABC transporter substrate-binding protein, partial [Phytoactinopolyspora endophytica]|uniref:ABC transporter substrate-binding protein n=1 Tax=Phytoactinopolyspora endophytica TaxID=1642495 RepID=UPI00101C987A